MNKSIDFILHNEIFSAVVILLGIFGTIFGIYSYFKSKQVKKLTYRVIDSEEIYSNKIEGLSLTFKGNAVESLYRTEILLINSGNVDLIDKFFLENEPIKIIFNISKQDVLDFKTEIINDKISEENLERRIKKLEIKDTKADSCYIEFSINYLKKKSAISFSFFHAQKGIFLDIDGTIVDGDIVKASELDSEKLTSAMLEVLDHTTVFNITLKQFRDIFK